MASQPNSPVSMAAMPKLDADPVDGSHHHPSTTALQPSMATEDSSNGLTTEPQSEPLMKVATAAQETLEVSNAAAASSQPNINDNKPGESSIITNPTIPPKKPAEETSTTLQKAAKRQRTLSSILSTPSRPTEAVCHSRGSFTIQVSTLCPGEQGEGTVTAPKRPRSPSTSPPASPRVLNTISIDFHLPPHHPPSSNTPFPPVHVAYQFHAPSPPPRTPTKASRASSSSSSSPAVDALRPRIKRLNIRGRANDSALRSPVKTPPSRRSRSRESLRRHAFTHREPPRSVPGMYTTTSYRSPRLSGRKTTASRRVTPPRTRSTLRERRVPRFVSHMHAYTPPRRISRSGSRFPVVRRISPYPMRAPAERPTVGERGANAGARHDGDDVFADKACRRDIGGDR
ncbi:hypothetical protein F4815DRAFT_498765 [Daldinia loculata]|nr:hypothetical protein F4815DRAFT_498765 [Daldinia loculata]